MAKKTGKCKKPRLTFRQAERILTDALCFKNRKLEYKYCTRCHHYHIRRSNEKVSLRMVECATCPTMVQVYDVHADEIFCERCKPRTV